MTGTAATEAGGRRSRPGPPVPAAGVPATISALVTLVRIRACAAGGASVLLGAFLSGGDRWLISSRSLLAAASIALAVAAANVVNDIADVAADAAGKSTRPLPSGRIRVKDAKAGAVLLTGASLALAFPLGPLPGLWMAGLLALAISYSFTFKSTIFIGNMVVAFCASVPVIYGSAAAGPVTTAVWIAAALSFLFIVSYETLKTFADRAGDASVGLRTLATSSESISIWLFRALAALLMIAALAASAASPQPIGYAISIVPLLVLLGYAIAVCSRSTLTDAAIQRSLRLLRIAWLIGLIDMLLLR